MSGDIITVLILLSIIALFVIGFRFLNRKNSGNNIEQP